MLESVYSENGYFVSHVIVLVSYTVVNIPKVVSVLFCIASSTYEYVRTY